jgi:predicted nucleotidyltransferase
MAVLNGDIEKAIELAVEFGVKKLLLFGSALTNPENANDLDLGVSGIEPSKFFLFGGKLENLIYKNVDLVPLDMDTPFINYIKNNGKYIYEN